MGEGLKANVCEFCGVSTSTKPICGGCARRVAELILSPEQGFLERWWQVSTSESMSPREDLIAALNSTSGEPLAEWDEATGDWKDWTSEKGPAALQAATHADLAVAYLEMNLPFDAIFTAANAIRIDVTAASTIALTVLFHPRLMRPGASTSLRQFLFPG